MKKVIIIIISTLLGLTLLSTIGFFVYTSIYYKAEQSALDILELREDIVVTKDITYIPSTTPSDIGFIFYPGAKVESNSYLPLLDMISKEGINVYLIQMPFNLALLGSNKAEEVFELYENDKWFIGGHSMGGAFASSYASSNEDKIDGLILLGAYIYGDYPINKSITIYGEHDKILSELDYTQNVHKIDGGNHAYFGNYGEQKGDGIATITKCAQQEQTTNKISDFTKNM
ncbi:MAG: alpha/beta hydrolase [bacterium]